MEFGVKWTTPWKGAEPVYYPSESLEHAKYSVREAEKVVGATPATLGSFSVAAREPGGQWFDYIDN